MSDRAERHTCHAEACDLRTPPAMFMCRAHWFRLPKRYRDAIWLEYVDGQEDRLDPTPAYLEAAHNAIEWLATAEGRRRPVELELGGES